MMEKGHTRIPVKLHRKVALIQVANIAGNAAGKTRGTYLGDRYRRLTARRGAMRASRPLAVGGVEW